ncbi:MAG TPA: glycosyltransferase [Sphingomicrobium sp.]|nr:glycosyltransferase [Sphingomicrobium sp.]
MNALPLVSLAPSFDKRHMQSAPHGDESADQRPTVVIYRSPLFNASETFVRAHPEQLRRYRPLLAGLEDKGNIPLKLLGSTYLPQHRSERLRGRLGDLGWLASRLTPEEPRLIHAHFGPDGLTALPLALRLRIPLVTTLRGYDVSRTQRSLLLSGRLSWIRYALGRERLMRGGDLFLAVSDALRSMAIRAGYPADRTLTHYNGVDLKAFSPSGGADGTTILHVGRLVEKKGTALLLASLARTRAVHPKARLVIIGDGPLRSSLEDLSGQLGLGEAVRFLGARPSSVVTEWMRRAAVLAVPSLTARDGDAEGLPNVAVEAAASGLAVVGSDHSGIPEAIADGRSGFVVPQGEVEPLAARLIELLSSSDLRRSMGAAGRSLAEARFDRDVQAEELERLYDSVLVRHAARARAQGR